MQQQEINKIKELVKVSSLLSQSEKEEWLALAGIMNDKQLWELQKILEPSARLPALSLRPPKLEMEIPPLKHIMNLPKAGQISSFPQYQSQTPQKPQKFQEAGKPFWQKIKDVLKEKELPPGHPEAVNELELPAPNQYQVSSIKYQAEKLKTEKPFFSQKPPSSLPKPPLVPRPPVRPAPPKPAALPVKLSSLQKEVTGLAEEALGKGPKLRFSEDRLFVPGLQDTRILMDAKLAKPEVHAPPTRTPPPLVRPIAKSPPAFKLAEEKHAAPAGVSNLEQISNLTEEDAVSDLSAPLKTLSARVGYHKLLSALEKSPLFQAYINTGLSVLSGKQDLETSQVEGKILSREEFERFVDVLRNIKN